MTNMIQKKLTDEQRDYLQALGVDVVNLPAVYDKASLFDYVNKLLVSLSDALGTDRPSHQVVLEATEKVIADLDLLNIKDN